MKKFIKILSIVFGSLAAILILAGILIDDIDVKFKEEQARDKISEFIPYKQEKDSHEIEISKLDISFADDSAYKKGKTQGEIEFEITFMERKFKAISNIETGISYRNSSFYLDKPVFSDFQMINLELQESDKKNFDIAKKFTNKHKDKINGFLNKAKAKFSKDESSKSKFTNFLDPKFVKEKSIQFAKDNISNFPIFSLEGDLKKTAASMILKDLRFEDKTAIITLSVSKFVGKLFLYIAALILGVLTFIAQMFLFLTGRQSFGITDL